MSQGNPWYEPGLATHHSKRPAPRVAPRATHVLSHVLFHVLSHVLFHVLSHVLPTCCLMCPMRCCHVCLSSPPTQVQQPDLAGVSHVMVDEIHERGMNEDFLLIILRDLLLYLVCCPISPSSLQVQQPDLAGVSHVMVDEIHERGMNEDFLLIILRDLLPRRPDLRLVLMSATINAELFSDYFNKAPMAHIPGFTHPVQQLFLEHDVDVWSSWVGTSLPSPDPRLPRQHLPSGICRGAYAGVLFLSPPLSTCLHPPSMYTFFLAGCGRVVSLLCFHPDHSRIPLQLLTRQARHRSSGIRGGAYLQCHPSPPLSTPFHPVPPVCTPLHPSTSLAWQDVDIWSHYSAFSWPTQDSLTNFSSDKLDIDLVASVVEHIWSATPLHPSTSLAWQDVDIWSHYSAFTRPTQDSLANFSPDKLDIDLVAFVVEHICRNEAEGAVLVFLTGWDEISKLLEALKAMPVAGQPSKVLLLPLHGSMPTIQQKDIFNRPPPGIRKVVLATSIAETSITIDDVVFVVDCGKVAFLIYSFLCCFCSFPPLFPLARKVQNAVQNAVQLLETIGAFTPDEQLPSLVWGAFPCCNISCKSHPLPPCSLNPCPLRCRTRCSCWKQLEHSLDEQLPSLSCHLPNPLPLIPTQPLSGAERGAAVQNAVQLLETIGAFTPDEQLTPLGCHLAAIPVEPRIGKMLIFGAIFNCLAPALTIAASLAYRDPFVLPLEKKELADAAKKEFSKDSRSDHITLLNAFEGWRAAKQQGLERPFCWDNFLSAPVLQMVADMRGQFLQLLSDIGFYDPRLGLHEYSKLASDQEMLSAVICAGLYPSVAQVKVSVAQVRFSVAQVGGYVGQVGGYVAQVGVSVAQVGVSVAQVGVSVAQVGVSVAQIRRQGTRFVFFTKDDGHVKMHPSSVNAFCPSFSRPWLVYNEKVKTSDIFLRDSTMVSDFALLMFGGNFEPAPAGRTGFDMLGGYLHFSASAQTAQLVQDLRQQLDGLLREKIENPSLDVHAQGERVVAAVRSLLSSPHANSVPPEEAGGGGGGARGGGRGGGRHGRHPSSSDS
ncbi:unnamed protein product [Closterium sp. Naga37s-1]|nr:unnamed protein product [Closterium sp. Naga37s-1]